MTAMANGLASTLLGAAGAAVGMVERNVPGLGGKPDPEAMARSPQFRDGRFRNRTHGDAPSSAVAGQFDDPPASVRAFLFDGEVRRPPGLVPVVHAAGNDALSTVDLGITWFGHASSLVEIEGARVLVDPVWSERVSPVSGVGPRRLHVAPRMLTALGTIDVVAISHDHYDHLDMATVRTLTRITDAPFVVPLGVGAHLRRWDVPEARIIELDWGESHDVDGVRLTATPAQHFSGRALVRNNTLWASWVIAGGRRKVFYTGDTGYCGAFNEIGSEHGPFDATLVQVGAYNVSWPGVHMTPEEGVLTHRDLGGGLMIPVHWATFPLALHPWGEPAERVWLAAREHDVQLATPRPGERIDVDRPTLPDPWWQRVGAGAADVVTSARD